MIADIANFHPLSKLWLFVFDREMNKNEVDLITIAAQDFASNWLAHGKPVKAAFVVNKDYMWFCADSNFETVSGCSIDSLFRIITHIEDNFKTNCKDKYWLLTSTGERYHYTDLVDFTILKEKRILNLATNNLDMWINEPFIKSENSWIKNKFLNTIITQ